ncbi:agmatinase [Cyphellophora europaea CBS 101466]|uniref:Agmatinase n=1 Tax=Cyphellophora europaea (strain CBS 101466) TaxID=1220924 RepID=W2RWI4_CYPE1|nr:agmatinase [Cyphellophora europaea CBS 101466]ETN40802.1 agmatinase [Cyphellophora europaea CBS 101466]
MVKVCLAAAALGVGVGLAASDATAESLDQKWGSDWPFSGIATFAHLDHVKCLVNPDAPFDIGVIGAPFDTTTSYRPGARFGPRAIRVSSARQSSIRSFNYRAGINPYRSWARVLDCGDIPITSWDNALALRQMTDAFFELGSRQTPNGRLSVREYRRKPKLMTMGGDHSILLPILRALHAIYGRPLSVLHFDAHMDTRNPAKYIKAWVDADDLSTQSFFNHGSMLWLASKEGLVANASSVHAGLRARINDYTDFDDDTDQGWHRIFVDDIDDMGVSGVIESILNRVGSQNPVYISVDIDVIDPGSAPGTGTPEPGGWTTRELIRILRGLENLNIVGADVVEVSPSYDAGEITSLAAAQIMFELITNMVKRGTVDVPKYSSSGVNINRDEL